jgi:hypothetical protein
LILAVPGAPKNITFTSAAMKKKLQPGGMDLAIEGETIESTDYAPFSRAGSLSSSRNFVIRGRSSIKIVPTCRVGRDKSSCAQNRASVVVTNSTSDASISMPKVNSTNSLRRSGFQ